jgi:predicted outer membrane repeat protein
MTKRTSGLHLFVVTGFVVLAMCGVATGQHVGVGPIGQRPVMASTSPSPFPTAPDQPPTGGATTAAAWYDGMIQYSTIINCVSIIQGAPYQEYGAGAFTGFYANPDVAQPGPNQVYYIHVYVAGLGNSCSGQRFYFDVALPANTSLAYSPTNPIRCYANGSQLGTNECQQSMQASPYNAGAYTLLSTDTQHAQLWPLPVGGNWEFQIPVQTSTTLTNSTLQANVWVLDGNSSPWLHPQEGVYVFSSTPTIIYPTPSTTLIQATTAHSEAYAYTYGQTGTAYFDIGTTTAYGYIVDPAPITTSGTAWRIWDDWGPPALAPDTLYHWRLRFVASGGGTYVGADQTFRTLPDGRTTVGTGTSASCTEAAFATALATAGTKQIVFDCGTQPVTIPITASRSLSSPLTIDGGNKVTLQRQAGTTGNFFTVLSGAIVTLTKITLTGASSTTCGGAVTVNSGGTFTAMDARFAGNKSNAQGGAVCNSGTTTLTNSAFTDNQSLYSHGGAVGSYGSLTVVASRFFGNRAAVNGGAIDMGGSVSVTASMFAGNVAGYRGGGINTYGGSLTIGTSAFQSNLANLYGGGLASDASTTTVTASTFASNSSANHGGGIEISGNGGLTLANSTVTDNIATTEGGGIYWTAGSTATLVSLNNTIFANTSGLTTGNVYTGSSGYNSLLTFKNTIVSSGRPVNCSGIVQSSGNNLEDRTTCGFVAAGDRQNLSPNLGPLQNNGGPTLTRMPLAGSPAIDAGNNAGGTATDQRGYGRPTDGDANGTAVTDIGAVEPGYPLVGVSRIFPTGGSTAGGTLATILGANLAGSHVTVDGSLAATMVSTSATMATFTMPAHAAGQVSITVTGANGSGTTLSSGYTYFAMATPSAFSATASSSTQINLSWGAVGGATSYEVWRNSALHQSTTSTSLADTGLTANTTFVYRVRAIGSGGSTSAFTVDDAATTTAFTDASLAGGVVKVSHIAELRAAVNAMRAAAGLDPAYFTDQTLTARGTTIKRVHVTELRSALDIARAALGLPALTYTDPTVTWRYTPVRAVHLAEIRAGVQ